MEEMQSNQKEAISANSFKKAWRSFASQSTKVKISLLTLLVAVITIPSLTTFVSNTNAPETDKGHAQVISPVPVNHYIVISRTFTAYPNFPDNHVISCNPGDLAISGGPYEESGNLADWVVERAGGGMMVGNTPIGKDFDIMVRYSGTTAQQYNDEVLCQKNAKVAITPGPSPLTTPTPAPTFICVGGPGCVTPTPKPTLVPSNPPTPTPHL